MMGLRARVDAPDVILLLIGLGALTMFLQTHHRLAIVLGAVLAYAGLILALFILPRRWLNAD